MLLLLVIVPLATTDDPEKCRKNGEPLEYSTTLSSRAASLQQV